MRAANITTVQDLTANIGAMVASATPLPSVNPKNDFQSVIKASSEKSVNGVSTNTSVNNDSSKTDMLKNSSKDILKDSSTKVKKAENPKADDKSVAETISKMRQIVKDELQITDEELDAMLSQLSMNVTDLIMPDKVAVLMSTVKEVESIALLTDDTLSNQLTSIVSQLKEVVNDAAETLEISKDTLWSQLESKSKEMLDKATTDEPEQTQTFTAVVTDQETGKEIKVTYRSNRGEAAKQVKTEEMQNQQVSPENVSSKEDNKNDSRNYGGNAHHSLAESFVQNLTQSLAETNEVQSNFSGTYIDAANIINQIVDSIRVNVNADTTSMELQLNPESLGKINLNVATKDGVVTATITAQNEAVKTIIENQLVELKENLNNQGLKVSEVEVTIASHGFDMNQGEGQNEQNNQNRRTASRFRGIDEIPGDDGFETEAQEILEARGNSVSYTA